MKLYKIKQSPESAVYGLMAVDTEGYCYVYSANTELWHRSGEQEVDYEFDRESIYEPIAKDKAEALRSGVRPADRRRMGDYVRELEEQPAKWVRTSAEVGLTSAASATHSITAASASS